MAFNIDITTPADTSLISAFPLNERNNRITLEGIITNDHIEATGDHDKVGLRQRTVGGGDQPMADGTLGFLFCEDVAGITELFYQDDTPNPIQITSNGVLAPDKLPLAGGTMTGHIVLDPNVQLRVDNVGSGVKGEIGIGGSFRTLVDIAAVSDEVLVGDQSEQTWIRADAANGYIASYLGGPDTEHFFHEGNMGTGSLLDADLVDGVEGVAIFSSLVSGAGQFFEVAGLPIAAGNGSATPHGIAAPPPRIVKFFMVCVVAENGYSIGDEIELSTEAFQGTGSGVGVMVGANATDVFYRVGNGNGLTLGLNRATGARVSPSFVIPANWTGTIRAWK